MNWKRIMHAAICLLVVCCLLFNLSPIRAEAVAITGSTIAVVGSAAIKPIVIAIIKGLGLGALSVGGSVAIDAIADQSIAHMAEMGLMQEMTLEIFGYTFNGYSLFGITPKIIDAIRSFLFESGTISENVVPNVSGFSTTELISTNVYPSFSLRQICLGYPSQAVQLMESLGIYDKVAITTVSPTSPFMLCGFYFDVNGRLCCAEFDNPMDYYSFKQLGVYSLTDLSLSSSTFCNVRTTGSPAIAYSYPIYYSTSLAENNYDGSGGCLAFDFTRDCSNGYFQLLYRDFPNSAHWGSGATYDFYCSGIKVGYYPNTSSDYFTWDDTYISEFVAIDGLTTEYVASEDVSLEFGYPDWYQNAVTTIDPSTDEEITLLPIPPVTSVSDALALSQNNIWSGSLGNTSVQPDSGTDIDADTFIERVLSGIRDIFVPSQDYLSGKVDALAAEFVFADSIVQTVKGLVSGLNGITTEPPVIYIDLGAQEGFYDMGGKVPFIDLRWYERYKPTADRLISAFLWICFLWRLLIHLPGIISGASGSFSLMPMPSTQTFPTPLIPTQTTPDVILNAGAIVDLVNAGVDDDIAYMSRAEFRKANGLPDDGLGGGYAYFVPRNASRNSDGNSDR